MAASSKKTWLGVALVLVGLGGVAWWWFQRDQPVDMVRVLELNNRGIAFIEHYDYSKAAEAFQEIVTLAPSWVPGRVNLGIALLNEHKDEAAVAKSTAIFEKLLKEEPRNNHAEFCLAILKMYHARELGEAIQHFKRVIERDPADPHSWFFMAGLLNQMDDLEGAKTGYEKAVALDPYIPGCYNGLQLLYRRLGDDKRANELLKKFTELQQSKWESKAATAYSEMGKYAEVIGRNPSDKAPAAGPLPLFTHDEKLQVQLGKDTRWALAADLGAGPEGDLRRALRLRFGGTSVVLDCNGDGKLDVFLASAVVRGGKLGDLLLVNDGDGKFHDITTQAGLADGPASLSCSVGDFDNDGFPDLLLTGTAGIRLMRHGGAAEVRFTDVTKTAGLDQLSGVCLGASFVDLDQDGDLDLVVAILGNDIPAALAAIKGSAAEAKTGGVGVFLNIGEAPPRPNPKTNLPLSAKFQRADHLFPGLKQASFNVAISDLDSDRDIDVLLFDVGEAPVAILNDRMLKFHTAPLAEKMLPKGKWNGAVVLDLNRDERSDLFVVGAGQKPALLVQGKPGGDTWFSAGVTNAPTMVQAQAIDVDLDGWTDIVGLSEERKPTLLHNDAGKLVHIKEGLGLSADWPKDIAAVLAGDFDGRCQVDFIVWSESEGLRLYRSQDNGNRGLPVAVAGRRDTKIRSNNDGIGTRIGVQVRDHWTCAEVATLQSGPGQSRQPILFGLGKHSRADFVSLRWPDGLWQAEMNVVACQLAQISETDRRIDSCPLLFTWNGHEFVFVTDFLGAGSMGEPLPGGGNRPPRPEESIKIEASQLVAKDGRYTLKIAEPMDEVMYLDRLQLVVVDHPADLRVYPDERFPAGSRDATQDLLAFDSGQQIFPKEARDHRGRDVTEILKNWDRRTVDGFSPRGWLGFAEEHAVELDFGAQLAKFSLKEPLALFLAGWTDYAYPASIWAAAQAGQAPVGPLLERMGEDGQWHVVRDDLSFPAGLPRMMTYDITGLVSGPTCKLRIRTNLHVYWDQIFIAPLVERVPQDKKNAAAMRIHHLDVAQATLEKRGCMQEFSPDGKQPTIYAYDRLEKIAVTRQIGKLTKFGDVTELLTERDNRFVILAADDELTVNFAADKLPPLPAGWKRSFVLRTWGYCKDASPWTATGDTIEPLPFHGMSNFPYGPGERYPQTPLHADYLKRWQTRQIGR